MKHPRVPCHESLKPVLKQARAEVERLMAAPGYGDNPCYICHILIKIGGSLANEAGKHIMDSLDGWHSFGSWLEGRDSEFKSLPYHGPPETRAQRTRLQDSARLAWLDWLTKENDSVS